jgi:hypothetical protein
MVLAISHSGEAGQRAPERLLAYRCRHEVASTTLDRAFAGTIVFAGADTKTTHL